MDTKKLLVAVPGLAVLGAYLYFLSPLSEVKSPEEKTVAGTQKVKTFSDALSLKSSALKKSEEKKEEVVTPVSELPKEESLVGLGEKKRPKLSNEEIEGLSDYELTTVLIDEFGLESVNDSIVNELKTKPMGEKFVEKISKIDLQKQMRERLEHRLSRQEKVDLAKFYNEDIVRQYRRNNDFDESEREDLKSFMIGFQESRYSKERMASIRRVIEAEGTVDSMVAMSVMVFKGMKRKIAESVSPSKADNLDDEVQKSIANMRPTLERNAIAATEFVFKKAPDEDVESYANAVQTHNVKSIFKKYNEMYSDTMLEIGEAIGEVTVELMEKK